MRVSLLKTFAVWAMFTCCPPLMLALFGGLGAVVDIKTVILLFLPFLVIPATGTMLLWVLELRLNTTAKFVLAGVTCGLFGALLLGFIYSKIYQGFENQVVILVGTIFSAALSAAGGGFAGWLRCPPRERSNVSANDE